MATFLLQALIHLIIDILYDDKVNNAAFSYLFDPPKKTHLVNMQEMVLKQLRAILLAHFSYSISSATAIKAIVRWAHLTLTPQKSKPAPRTKNAFTGISIWRLRRNIIACNE